MTPQPQWRFREMQPGEMNVDPIEGEFFTTEALRSITDALVRESIQNALDAAAGGEPVTVRFSHHLSPIAGPDSNDFRKLYIDGLSPHLHSRHSGLPEAPPLTEPLSFMVIEDYGTRGLQGDVLQYDDLDDDVKKNDFFYFWRNIGRTKKELTDLGRWGLGKTVFQAASRINSFFGLTVRKDDSRAYLMGQSVLKIHKVEGSRYAPYGYFGFFNGYLALPVEDPNYHETFSRHFELDRVGKPGLSVVIPYPDREICLRGCANSVIRHYFFPILAGRLIVEFRFDGKKTRLEAANLGDYLKKSQWAEKQGLPGLMDLARWAIQQPREAYIHLQEPQSGRRPKLTEALFEDGQLDTARRDFAEGRRLAFHVPVSVQKQSGEKLFHTGFSVFLERDEKLDKPEDHFIRQGITIPEVSSLKHKGIRAIVSISDNDLSAFLGDAENPAHTQWERNSKKFKSKYKLGPATLDFVKSSPRELVKILTQPQKGRDENLLKHIFSLPLEPIGDAEKAGKNKSEKQNKPLGGGDIIELEPGSYLQLSTVKGGFRLSRRTKATQVPRFITLWIAYEVRSGNPFKKYTVLDFDVSREPIQVKYEGVNPMLSKENTIQFEVIRSDFRVTVTGFDTHRDLRVKTHP
ncbi:MAG: hypothetical protein R6V84_18130 [Desulfobacterales bacterium]